MDDDGVVDSERMGWGDDLDRTRLHEAEQDYQHTTDGQTVLPDGRPAPRFEVVFRCPECSHLVIANAYAGVVMCGSHEGKYKPIMEPLGGIEDVRYRMQRDDYKRWAEDHRGKSNRPGIGG